MIITEIFLPEAIVTVHNRPLKVIKNPNSKQVQGMIDKAEYGQLCWIVDQTGDLFIWDKFQGDHYHTKNALGITEIAAGFVGKGFGESAFASYPNNWITFNDYPVFCTRESVSPASFKNVRRAFPTAK